MSIPATIRTIADAIGLDAAIRLSQATRPKASLVYVPSSPLRAGHPIARCLHGDEISRLQASFGGEHIAHQTPNTLKRRAQAIRKRAVILDGHKQGMRGADIAALAGCTEAYVSKTIRKHRGLR